MSLTDQQTKDLTNYIHKKIDKVSDHILLTKDLQTFVFQLCINGAQNHPRTFMKHIQKKLPDFNLPWNHPLVDERVVVNSEEKLDALFKLVRGKGLHVKKIKEKFAIDIKDASVAEKVKEIFFNYVNDEFKVDSQQKQEVSAPTDVSNNNNATEDSPKKLAKELPASEASAPTSSASNPNAFFTSAAATQLPQPTSLLNRGRKLIRTTTAERQGRTLEERAKKGSNIPKAIEHSFEKLHYGMSHKK